MGNFIMGVEMMGGEKRRRRGSMGGVWSREYGLVVEEAKGNDRLGDVYIKLELIEGSVASQIEPLTHIRTERGAK